MEFFVVVCNNSLVIPKSSNFECASYSNEDVAGNESGVAFVVSLLLKSLFTDVQKFVKFNGSGSSSFGNVWLISHKHERICSIDQRWTASGWRRPPRNIIIRFIYRIFWHISLSTEALD